MRERRKREREEGVGRGKREEERERRGNTQVVERERGEGGERERNRRKKGSGKERKRKRAGEDERGREIKEERNKDQKQPSSFCSWGAKPLSSPRFSRSLCLPRSYGIEQFRQHPWELRSRLSWRNRQLRSLHFNLPPQGLAGPPRGTCLLACLKSAIMFGSQYCVCFLCRNLTL